MVHFICWTFDARVGPVKYNLSVTYYLHLTISWYSDFRWGQLCDFTYSTDSEKIIQNAIKYISLS